MRLTATPDDVWQSSKATRSAFMQWLTDHHVAPGNTMAMDLVSEYGHVIVHVIPDGPLVIAADERIVTTEVEVDGLLPPCFLPLFTHRYPDTEADA